MPVQINELVIKVDVNDSAAQGNATPAAPSGDNKLKELARETVESVLQILGNKNER